jgi:predicted secreted protein
MVVQGTGCLFELNTGGGFLPYACAKGFNISLNTETVEITSPVDGVWKDFDYDSLSYTIELSGLMKIPDDSDVKAFDIMGLQMGFTEALWRAIFDDGNGNVKVCTGTVIITNTSLNVQAGSMVDVPISLLGKGPYTIGDTTEICEAEIGTGLFDVTVALEGGGGVTITINSVTGSPTRYDWSVDGGAENSSFTNSWFIGGLSDGPHTLVIYPVCANGVKGVQRIVDFSVA